MLRWSLLFLALIFALSASLTVFRAPTLATWMLAILSGEYGQYLWFFPALIGGIAILTHKSYHPIVFLWLTVALGAAAISLFLRPTFKATEIGEGLSARMDEAFGPIEHPYGSVFKPMRYLLRTPVPTIPPVTMVYETGKEPLSLDFYRTTASEGAVPCVVVIHGGGWDSGKRDELPAMDHILTEQGYSVASIDYRLAPKHPWPAQSVDVRTALMFLKANAKILGIDPTRFVLFGRSAGGQIATAYAYQAKDPSIRGVAAFYSPHDLRFAWQYADPDDVLNSMKLLTQFTGGTPDQVGPVYDSASAIFHVTAQTPPTLLVHGAIDTLVWNRQSERLAAELERKHVPHVFIELPWATHAFDYNIDGPGGQLALAAFENFLSCVTR